LQQTARRILPRQISKVEQAPKPRVLGPRNPNPTLKLVVRRREFEPHNRRIAKRCLVEIVQPVHNAQDGHQMAVDLPQQPLIGLLAQLQRLPLVPLERLHRRIRIVRVLEYLVVDVLHHLGRRCIDHRVFFPIRRIRNFLARGHSHIQCTCNGCLCRVTARPGGWVRGTGRKYNWGGKGCSARIADDINARRTPLIRG
jgi:hypothetical protein